MRVLLSLGHKDFTIINGNAKVKSSLFKRGGPFSTRLVLIGALRN